MKSLKEENPKLEHRERMQAVVDAWKVSFPSIKPLVLVQINN